MNQGNTKQDQSNTTFEKNKKSEPNPHRDQVRIFHIIHALLRSTGRMGKPANDP